MPELTRAKWHAPGKCQQTWCESGEHWEPPVENIPRLCANNPRCQVAASPLDAVVLETVVVAVVEVAAPACVGMLGLPPGTEFGVVLCVGEKFTFGAEQVQVNGQALLVRGRQAVGLERSRSPKARGSR